MKKFSIFGLAFSFLFGCYADLNILFITVDDMNADSLGVFGCERHFMRLIKK